MQALRFDVRDLLRAPRLAFSLQRMWIQLVGMGTGYLIYVLLTYVSLVLQGNSIAFLWHTHGLLPCLFAQTEAAPWYSWLVYGLASFSLFVSFLLTHTAVARAAYMIMKGNHFYSWREAFAFSRKKMLSVVLAPVSLVILILLIILSSAVLGWIGRIPYLGELGISFFTLFWFLGALFLFYSVIVAVVSIWYTPCIIAASDEDAFEAVFQSFSMTWTQPWRLLLYQMFNVVIALAAIAVFAFAAKKSVVIMNTLLGLFMGSDYVNLAYNGQAMIQNWLAPAQNIMERFHQYLIGQIYFSKEFTAISSDALPTTVVISSYFFSAGLLIIAGWVISYGLSCYAIGNLLTFLALRKRKDGENLLERKDREEEVSSSDPEDTCKSSTES